MDKKEFAVGQVWETRGGKQEEISKIYDDNAKEFPIVCVSGKTYKLNGHYVHQSDKTAFDLLRLVSDPVQDAIEPTPARPASDPAPEPAAIVALPFEVGQTWRTRCGNSVTITSIEPELSYPVHCDDDLRRDAQGFWLRERHPDEDDLVELIPNVPAPDAEVIADGLIQEAGAVAMVDAAGAGCADSNPDGNEGGRIGFSYDDSHKYHERELVDSLIAKIAPVYAMHNRPEWESTMMSRIEIIIQRRNAILKGQTSV